MQKKQRFREIKQKKINPKTAEKNQKPRYAYASVQSKVKAFLTDSFMLLMPIMYSVFYFVMGGREGFAQEKALGWLYILIPLVIVQTLFMFKSGQTPGYRAYMLEVIDESTGKKPSLGIALFRNLSAVLSLLTLVGWTVMFFRKDHKNLHDLLSGTAVIEKPHNV
jgi:uncharacterized RDD family membrane protein YckC